MTSTDVVTDLAAEVQAAIEAVQSAVHAIEVTLADLESHPDNPHDHTRQRAQLAVASQAMQGAHVMCPTPGGYQPSEAAVDAIRDIFNTALDQQRKGPYPL